MPYRDPIKRASANKAWREHNKEQCHANRLKWSRANKEKLSAQHKIYRQTEKGTATRRAYWVKHMYGISEQEYQNMFEAQSGLCAVCHRPETKIHMGKPCRLCVDHNHLTKEIRALLCRDCNSTIGLLSESPDRMRALAAYVELYDKRSARPTD